jgi:hypothetical protein
MKKLKNKIFWVIFSMLTIFLFSILCIFNYQDYEHEKSTIQNNLMRMQNIRDKKDDALRTQNNSEDDTPKEFSRRRASDFYGYSRIYCYIR